MNSNFFNSKYTLLTTTPVDVGFSNMLVNFFGTKEELYFKVKTYEYENDEVFNGHFYAKDFDLFIQYFMEYSLDKLDSTFVPHKHSYFHKVNHDGIHTRCTLDSSVSLLSGYALSFFLNSGRTKLNEYVNLARHRVVMDEFNTITKLLPRLL